MRRHDLMSTLQSKGRHLQVRRSDSAFAAERAWATGVYFVVQPEVSRATGSDIGWLRIGPGASLGDSARDWSAA
jgi:hypothetical protein